MSNNDVPKHKQVYLFLRRRIESGEYHPGQRLPTEQELLDQFGVSRPTVVRAFRDLELEGLITRRRGSGSFVKEIHKQTDAVFGVISAGMFNQNNSHMGFCGDIIEEVSRGLHKKGGSLMFADALTDRDEIENPARALDLARSYIKRQVAGIFFIPLILPPEKSDYNARIVQELKDAGIAVVLLDRDVYNYPRRSLCDLLSMDHLLAGYLATTHLLETGCRKIDFVTEPVQENASSVLARISGYRLALVEHGIKPSSSWIHPFPDSNLEKMKNTLTKSGADAYLCYNDNVAAFVMRCLGELDLKIPQDVKVVGFDDSAISRHLPIPLTTMRQPGHAIGRAAVDVMLDRLEHPEDTEKTLLFSPRLIARASTGFEESIQV